MPRRLALREPAAAAGIRFDPQQPVGNDLALWFEPGGFDAAVRRMRAVSAQVVTDVHVNPQAGHREVWIRDPGGYLERGLGD